MQHNQASVSDFKSFTDAQKGEGRLLKDNASPDSLGYHPGFLGSCESLVSSEAFGSVTVPSILAECFTSPVRESVCTVVPWILAV